MNEWMEMKWWVNFAQRSDFPISRAKEFGEQNSINSTFWILKTYKY